MSTLTPNYGLIVPESTDTVEQVRADYATNLGLIDNIGGGGTYTAGDGIKIASNVISLEYFSVVNGAVNITFDDGN